MCLESRPRAAPEGPASLMPHLAEGAISWWHWWSWWVSGLPTEGSCAPAMTQHSVVSPPPHFPQPLWLQVGLSCCLVLGQCLACGPCFRARPLPQSLKLHIPGGLGVRAGGGRGAESESRCS